MQRRQTFLSRRPGPAPRPVAACGIEHGNQPLRRRIDEEEQLGKELFLARHGGQRLDFFDGEQLAVDNAQLEMKLGIFAGPLGKDFGQRHRIAGGESHGIDALQAAQRRLNLGSGTGDGGQLVLTTRYLPPVSRISLRNSKSLLRSAC